MVPLPTVAPGEEPRLTGIRGGRSLRRRLADFGFSLGITVRVTQCDRPAPPDSGGQGLAAGPGARHGPQDHGSTELNSNPTRKGARLAAAQHPIALAGNPNRGESASLNALVSAHQHVAKWAGEAGEEKG